MDTQWRYVWLTDELRWTYGDTGDFSSHVIGSHYYSERAVQFMAVRLGGPFATREFRRARFADLGRYVLAPARREVVRNFVESSTPSS
jgi:hypothetical protein